MSDDEEEEADGISSSQSIRVTLVFQKYYGSSLWCPDRCCSATTIGHQCCVLVYATHVKKRHEESLAHENSLSVASQQQRERRHVGTRKKAILPLLCPQVMQCLIPSYKQEQEDKKGSSFMAFAPKIHGNTSHLYSDNDSLHG
jgi:hypothetical protein